RAAAVHVGRGLQDPDRYARHLTLGDTRALAAAEGGKPPVRDERIGQPEARVVPRRRVLWPRVAEADDGAQPSALFAALGLLDLVGLLPLGGCGSATPLGLGLGRRGAFRGTLALFLFSLAHLPDQLGLRHLGRGLGARRRHLFGARRHHRRDREVG